MVERKLWEQLLKETAVLQRRVTSFYFVNSINYIWCNLSFKFSVISMGDSNNRIVNSALFIKDDCNP
ncbi:uncharacterized protein HKW66_Vig0199250 [Vigna angularis]|uniref:Uncharacterized protein n=1 Tax=Phaseolus angularis TaxID=3914 RepID=A0A8T0KPJ4_PHAAN|nr:uncharacterized protein HKW66_Vig0131140 [Vigna angularis]KAG2401039.1 uncharacterized protein HKW66_Vig0199250 [Vigna angularis]